MVHIKIAVITPVGRESETLARFIDEVNYEIGPEGIHYLITDDFTDSDSLHQIQVAQIRHKNLMWCHLDDNNNGIAGVYLEGYRRALLGNADYLLEIDAGYSHNPKEISMFLEVINDFDVIFGSRFSSNNYFKSTLKRFIISRGGSLLSRKVSKTPITDMTSGFQCFSRKSITQILKEPLFSTGPFFQTEMKIRAYRFNCRIAEIPITYQNPDHRIKLRNIVESLTILFIKYRKFSNNER